MNTPRELVVVDGRVLMRACSLYEGGRVCGVGRTARRWEKPHDRAAR